jgi:hypothetical protein
VRPQIRLFLPALYSIAVVAPGSAIAAAPPQTLRLQATFTDTRGTFYTDGLGYDSGEVVAIEEDSNWAGNGTDFGKVVTLSGMRLAGTFTTPLGTDIEGFPLITDATSTAGYEVVFGESDSTASIYARTRSMGATWASAGWGYPGGYFMGSSAANLRGTKTVEVIASDWNGNVKELSAASGAVLASYNSYTAHGEHISGHTTVADVLSTHAGSEIIVYGATTGRVIVLGDDGTSTLKELWISDSLPAGGYAEGTGPAVADIDGDGTLEIVVEGTGLGEIFAFDTTHGTGCKYVWSSPGGVDYYWGSPVIGEVLPAVSGLEVVVESVDSVVSVLKPSAQIPSTGTCSEGVVQWSTTVTGGGDAYFSPALGNLAGGAGLDIVAASYTTIDVIDAEAQSVAYTYTDATATFTPTAIIQSTSYASAPGRIWVSGWQNGKVYQFATRTGSPKPAPWGQFQSNQRHTGTL